jgi:hypothetical protein
MIGRCLTTGLPNVTVGQLGATDHPRILAFTLVMLVWGVTSEALREIISGFLEEVRFD